VLIAIWQELHSPRYGSQRGWCYDYVLFSTIFANFLGKTLAFLETDIMIDVLLELTPLSSKRHFCHFLSENILRILTFNIGSRLYGPHFNQIVDSDEIAPKLSLVFAARRIMTACMPCHAMPCSEKWPQSLFHLFPPSENWFGEAGPNTVKFLKFTVHWLEPEH
jgi:hypothetical protein